MTENEIGKIVVDQCIQLHRALGPGLLESVYEVTLARRLKKNGLVVARQVSVPIEFEGEKFDEGFRADLIVEGKVILVPRSQATTRPDAQQTGPLKSVEKVNPAHKKQLLTYLKLTGLKLGLLLNFGDELMKNGITRTINGNLDK